MSFTLGWKRMVSNTRLLILAPTSAFFLPVQLANLDDRCLRRAAIAYVDGLVAAKLTREEQQQLSPKYYTPGSGRKPGGGAS